MITLKNSMISALLILAILLSAWSILLTKQSRSTLFANDPNQLDGFIEEVNATIMNKAGQPALKISAPRMTHFSKDDTTRINKPHVTLYRQSPEPWYVDSDYAIATQGTQKITFINHVVIHHLADLVNPNTTMTTASLTIFPNTQHVETADAVTISQPDVTVHAIGMLANLDNGTVKLLSEAKGDYVPSS